MSAEMRTTTRAEEPIDPRYMRMYMSAISQELNRWGKWLEDHSDYEGYPGVNILVNYLYGAGAGTPGHRILCLEMPVAIYATHARVIRCTEAEQEAIWLYYVVRVKEDGTTWTLPERLNRAELTEDALWQRLRRAKRRILGIPVE